jgi:hypothetical protein
LIRIAETLIGGGERSARAITALIDGTMPG